MTASERRLIQRLGRFARCLELLELRHTIGAELDARIDAGEWSGSAHGRALLREADALAQRFGFTTARSAVLVCGLYRITVNDLPPVLERQVH